MHLAYKTLLLTRSTSRTSSLSNYISGSVIARSPRKAANFIYFYLSSYWIRLKRFRYYLSAILIGFKVLVKSYSGRMVLLALINFGKPVRRFVRFRLESPKFWGGCGMLPWKVALKLMLLRAEIVPYPLGFLRNAAVGFFLLSSSLRGASLEDLILFDSECTTLWIPVPTIEIGRDLKSNCWMDSSTSE
jgi:hypothetical protein